MPSKQVSVIFLVKDPPLDRLAALVEYLRVVSDEFIFVVDDRTDPSDTSIIQSWPDTIVVPFTWIDDFAAARNAALPLVTRPWTLHLDPDELPSMAMMQHILEVTAPDRSGPVAWLYWFRNFWGGVLGPAMEYHWHIRLWKSGHGQFYRKVHELVRLDGQDERVTRNSKAIKAPELACVIHSKPADRITADTELYSQIEKGAK